MLLKDEDRKPFKQWLLPKLESISEAEADVLADYVLALITAEGPKDTVKKNCVEALSDFLHDQARPFVNEVANAIEQRSWASGSKKAKTQSAKAPTLPTPAPSTAPIPSIGGSSAEPYQPTLALSADARAYNPRARASASALTKASSTASPNGASWPKNGLPDRPTGPSPSHREAASIARGHEAGNGRGSQSRKRKLDDTDTSETPDGQGSHQNHHSIGRPFKQTARRGGGNSRGGFGANVSGAPTPYSGLRPDPMLPSQRLPTVPTPPAGFPPMDPTNPMAFFATMAAVLGVPLPPVPLLPASGSNASKPTSRCKSYDTQGFCLLGSACPFEHGEAVSVPQYDSNHASLAVQPMQTTNGHTRGKGQYDMGSKGGLARGHARAAFSQARLSHGRTNRIIVVEQIPEEHSSEDDVRKFFSQYGTIIEVEMQPYKRLAIIKFEDHDAAQRAYDSPKVIFDNRFVKVYWYKPERVPGSQNNGTNGARKTVSNNAHGTMPEIYKEDEEMIDMEEFQKRQAEAQKAFEERRKKSEETAAKAGDVNKQLKIKEGEVRNLKLKLIEKSKAKGVEVINRRGDGSTDDPLLMNDLSTLQAEAEGLYAQHDSDTPSNRGRGGFRGSFRARGRFHSPRGRGAYRGRGYSGARSGVRRLDNRPRQFAIAGVQADSKKDKALRQYLLNAHGCEGVKPHMERPDTLIVGFSERYQAEMFLEAAANIPDVGKPELSWVPNDTSVILKSTEVEPFALHRDTDDESSTGDDEDGFNGVVKAEEPPVNGLEENLDVADDADQWL